MVSKSKNSSKRGTYTLFDFFFGFYYFDLFNVGKRFGTGIGILFNILCVTISVLLNVFVYLKIVTIYKRSKAIKCDTNEECCKIKGETDTYSCRQSNNSDNQCDRVTENEYSGNYECDYRYSELETGKKIELVVLFILFLLLFGFNLITFFAAFGLLGFVY